MTLNNEAVYPASLFTKRASERGRAGGRAREGAKEMPHGEQCDLVFPGNIHKQEQRLRPNQASESGFLWNSAANNYLVVYFNNTHRVYYRGGESAAEGHKRRTQAPAFMPAGFMSWSAKAINKPVVSRCVFTRKGREKNKSKATKANKARKRAGLFVKTEAFLNPSQSCPPAPRPPPVPP